MSDYLSFPTKAKRTVPFAFHQGKLGRKKAIIAVARKILVLIYKLLKSGGFYDPMEAKKPIQSPS